MDLKKIFKRKNVEESKAEYDTPKEDLEQANDQANDESKPKVEDVPAEDCKFCYEKFYLGDNAYKCPNCEYKAKRVGDRNAHIKKVHPNQLEETIFNVKQRVKC